MRLEALFTEFVELDGRPSLPQAAGLMRAGRHESFYLAAVPVSVQRALGAVVRAVSRC